MAFKPGLANVLNLKPTSSLRYTKYFPNNSEYASKVYPEKKRRLKHRDAETQTEEDIIMSTRKNNEIVHENFNRKEETRDQSHPKASQTERVDVLQSYTQTDNTYDVVEIAIQTEEVDVQDSSKSVYDKTQQNPTFENEIQQTSGRHDDKTRVKKKKRRKTPERSQTSEQPEDGSSSKKDKELRIIWNKMKNFGEPRVVVSVIGTYNKRTQTYDMADNLMLRKACNHVARFAGRCGFIYKEDETNFLQSVVNKCAPICDLPHTYGYSSVYISDNEIEQGIECVKEDEEHHTGGTKLNLFDIEKFINSKGQVSFEDGKKESSICSTIRVPVVLLVVNGDFDTLKHVKKAIYNNMSVVVVKGTGGAADLIASCLERYYE
ncbi:uncharacterized protein LOC127706587 [Mytilus californianus]|uniref:uncharacterized protein LOC127706587 n=1 Tax=Mytilus californianus TaxID=6549 RepID=UPI0022465F5A|nr:uncharacterized protein LOC127706587 [Mytilus californianus]